MSGEGVLETEATIDSRLEEQGSRRAHQAQDAIRLEPDETTGLLDQDRRTPGPRTHDEVNGKQPKGEPIWHGDEDWKGLPWWKTPSIAWMLPAFALYTIAFGGTVVPRVNLITDLVCRDYMSDKFMLDPNGPPHFGQGEPECDNNLVAKKASVFLMGDNIIGGLLAAIVSPYIGDLSDRYGRRGMMMFTSLGALVKEITNVWAATSPETFPLGWFYLGFISDGLCGTFITGLAIAHAYAADCTPLARRTMAFGFFQGTLFAGIGLGPILAAWIISATGSTVSIFYIALVFHGVYVLMLTFVVPESLSKRRREEAKEKYRLEKIDTQKSGLTSLQSISEYFRTAVRPLKILWPTGEGSSPAVRRNLLLLVVIDTVMFGVAMGTVTVALVYSRNQFHWGNIEQSEMVSVINTCRVVCLFCVLPLVTRILRGPAKSRPPAQSGCDWIDLLIIRVAVFFDTLGFLGYTVVRTGTLFIVSGCVAAIGGIGSPTMQSALTKHVPADKTGQLLGASAMLHSLARVVAPLIFTTIFYATVDQYKQAVFLSLALTFGFAWVLTWFLRPGVYIDNPAQPPTHGASESADDPGEVGRL